VNAGSHHVSSRGRPASGRTLQVAASEPGASTKKAQLRRRVLQMQKRIALGRGGAMTTLCQFVRGVAGKLRAGRMGAPV
jgi:hypothetical protein